MTDKSVRNELAELTEAVRELRDREVAGELRSLRAEVEKLRAERVSHHCHGSQWHCNWGHCGCFTFHSYTATYPNTLTVTCGTPSIVTYGGTSTATTTNLSGYMSVASGYNPAITTLGTGN
jgi:hypothetical protein